LRAKKQNVEEAILDLGIFYHKNRVLAAFKGLLESGLEIPFSEDFFPDNIEETIKGSHIEQYANLLKNENPEEYEKIFSGYLQKNNVNPQKISQLVATTFKKIKSST
ncbi:MAG: 50S ribosomal protein L18, partial [Promethearchaeota archaeon]